MGWGTTTAQAQYAKICAVCNWVVEPSYFAPTECMGYALLIKSFLWHHIHVETNQTTNTQVWHWTRTPSQCNMWCDETKMREKGDHFFLSSHLCNPSTIFVGTNGTISMGSVKVALQMMYTINWKNENWIWLTSDSVCLITSHISLT